MLVAHPEDVGPVEHVLDHLAWYGVGIVVIATLIALLALLVGRVLKTKTEKEFGPE